MIASIFILTQWYGVKLLQLKVNEDGFHPITYKGNKYWGFLEIEIGIWAITVSAELLCIVSILKIWQRQHRELQFIGLLQFLFFGCRLLMTSAINKRFLAQGQRGPGFPPFI